MLPTEVDVKMKGVDGVVRVARICVAAEKSIRLSIDSLGVAGSGDDLFDAMRALRVQLESRGLLLMCAGARVDAWPSGMSRDMSRARRVYINRIGQPSQNHVDIFAECDADQVGTVEAQQKHYDSWVKSF